MVLYLLILTSLVLLLSWYIIVKKVDLITPICLILHLNSNSARCVAAVAAMAIATSSPLYMPDLFNLGIYTPKNLARGACAALL